MTNITQSRVDIEQIERDARKLRADFIAGMFSRRRRSR